MSEKEHLSLVFVGHVDAGKSTIGGQLMYLTDMVDKRTLEKYEKEAKEKGRESWYLSWALDTNEEERAKGKTVEVGRAHFETERRKFTILDAPGHKGLVRNMIGGATQADVAVLVVSARRGEFEAGFDGGGQTREHAVIVKVAGVRHLIVLVNKMDDPTVKWQEKRNTSVVDPVFATLWLQDPDGCHFYSLFRSYWGIPPRSTFWEGVGPCFLNFIDKELPSIVREDSGPTRCFITSHYNDMGTIVMGRMVSGTLERGQSLVLMPNKVPVQVTQMWTDTKEVLKAHNGDSIKLKLRGVEETAIQEGFILCSLQEPCKIATVFDAEVVILNKALLASGYSCIMHMQSIMEENVICTVNKKTGERTKVRFVKQDETCILRLSTTETICLETFENQPQLGRFLLREDKTVAVGKVLRVLE